MNKNKLILPVTILLAAIIIGGFIFASQIVKQRSIDRQQMIKIEEDRKADIPSSEKTTNQNQNVNQPVTQKEPEQQPSIQSSPKKSIPEIELIPKTETKSLSWQLVKSWQGAGIKTTENFTIIGSEWRIKWSNKSNEGLLQIIVYKTGQDYPITLAANTLEETSDTSYVKQKGEFYLTINSANTQWIVEVEEFK